MPDPDLPGERRERAQHRRAHGHNEKLRQQQSLAIQRLADHTGDRTDEQHRQAASNRYQSDQDGRLGDLVSEDPGNQQLEPAHRIADPAGKPQA
jgi:hypothetical protein